MFGIDRMAAAISERGRKSVPFQDAIIEQD
jgi:hypothetical protein